jgi:hypothetical protein
MYGYHEGSTDASTNSSLEQYSIYIYIWDCHPNSEQEHRFQFAGMS